MNPNDQDQKIRRLSGEVFVVFGSQAVAALAGLVGLRFITTLLSKESFGELSLAMTAVSLIQLVFTKPFTSAVRRFYAVSFEENKFHQFSASCWRLVSILFTCIVVTGICCFFGVLSYSKHASLLCVLAFLTAGLQAPAGPRPSLLHYRGGLRVRRTVFHLRQPCDETSFEPRHMGFGDVDIDQCDHARPGPIVY